LSDLHSRAPSVTSAAK